ncbi:MAG TPA: hypothetical protein VGI20_14640, partial [Rhizomicrobium sp.]
RPDKPGTFAAPPGGWYDTGDIVSLDHDGYIAIKGRLKRFAKIGGEMVSLAVVESCASAMWPDYNHAALAVAGGRKGEEIVLVTTCPDAERTQFAGWVHNHGAQELAIPRRIVLIESIPVLGTGKTDYAKLTKTLCESGALAQQESSGE